MFVVRSDLYCRLDIPIFKHRIRFDFTENFENHSSFCGVNTAQAHIWLCVMLCTVVQLHEEGCPI